MHKMDFNVLYEQSRYKCFVANENLFKHFKSDASGHRNTNKSAPNKQLSYAHLWMALNFGAQSFALVLRGFSPFTLMGYKFLIVIRIE